MFAQHCQKAFLSRLLRKVAYNHVVADHNKLFQPREADIGRHRAAEVLVGEIQLCQAREILRCHHHIGRVPCIIPHNAINLAGLLTDTIKRSSIKAFTQSIKHVPNP